MMRRLRVWASRVADLFRRARRERELADELDSHLQLHIDDNLRAGMTPVEARRVALVKLGGIEATKEWCRDLRGFAGLDRLVQDLRYGVRMLAKHPGFTTVAVLSLALGIGATSTIFSVLNAAVLRPLPFREPDRLVEIREFDPVSGRDRRPTVSTSRAWMEQAQTFEQMAHGWFAGRGGLVGTVSAAGGTERIRLRIVGPDFFRLLAGSRPNVLWLCNQSARGVSCTGDEVRPRRGDQGVAGSAGGQAMKWRV